MKSGILKTTIATSLLGLVALLGADEINAQSRRNDNNPPQVYNQNQRNEIEKQRQYEEEVRLGQERQEQLRVKYDRDRNSNDRDKNSWERNARYKVFQNGKFFVTDARGLETLKQAVVRGYEQGFKNGLADRRKRRNDGYNRSNSNRQGNDGYQNNGYFSQQNSIDSKLLQHYFQKGFFEGYEDGFNTRKLRGWYQNDGNLSEKELRAILKYERF